MAAAPLAACRAALGITKSHSWPRVASDNPFSESRFKTLKYRPAFPDRFGSSSDTEDFGRRFLHCHNHAHHHWGLGLLTPPAVHHGPRFVSGARQAASVAECS